MANDTLLIGDVHGDIELVTLLGALPNPKVYVGDYLDSFDYSPEQCVATLRAVLDQCARGEAWALWGNHELSYAYRPMRCSGWNETTQALVAHELPRMHEQLRSCVTFPEHRIVVTHAGIDHRYWSRRGLTLDNVDEAMREEFTQAPTTWTFSIGRARGGMAKVGGPFWCDFNDEFRPVPGIRQVFGHSARVKPHPRVTIYPPAGNYGALREHASGDWCIDAIDTAWVVLALNPETGELRPHTVGEKPMPGYHPLTS